MALVQRPPKEGNATTYQGKVALGYTDILAAEVDADFDAIYAAWNGGADTVNIADGSITSAKLAPNAVGTRELADGGIQTVDLGDLQVTTPKLADGAVTFAKLDPNFTNAPGTWTAGGDLQGKYPNPTIHGVSGGVLDFTNRLRLYGAATYADIIANGVGSPGYDTSKPAWLIRMDYTGNLLEFWHSPAGASQSFTRFAFLDGAGAKFGCTLVNNTVSRDMLYVGTLTGNQSFVNSPTGFAQPSPGVWTTILTLPGLAVRGPTGGVTAVLLNIQPGISISVTGNAALVNQRITRNGVAICQSPYVISTQSTAVVVPLPGFSYYDKAPSGTTVTYAYQIVIQSSATTVFASGDASGGILAQEFD